ncbi:RICIN domain-containing protein [Polymorphospora sp. NPDC051019]|uniref:RICIN domain-containing protein n=1 Tax=Polymorphospora sp. NPDC051019 TaxID=3155725 RepID=UPI003441D3AD
MKQLPLRSRLAALGAVLTVVPAAVVGVVLSASPSAAAVPVNSGVYTLASASSGKCVQVAGAATGNAALLTQVACDGGAGHQQFRVSAQNGAFGLTNVNSGRCMDVPYSSNTSGEQLWQWTCGASANQTWTFTASTATTDRYLIRSASSGLCVSNKDGSTAGNNPIVQEPCADIARMQWRFNPAGGTPPPTTPPPGVPYSNTPDGFAGAAGTTGGAGGATVTVTNQADLERYASASEPYVIRVNAAITVKPYGKEIAIRSNKTVVGVARNGQIVNGGFFIGAGTSNVIIRNLTIRDTRMAEDDPDDKDYDYDGIQMDTANRIWIDHNHITRMNDGAIDSRKDTTNLTVSWNIIAEANKTFGIGWTENVTARMTIHHNWFRDTRVRVPSTDNVAYAHLYNNYLQNSGSGNHSRGRTKMVLENSYYDRVTNPYYRDSGAELRQSGNVVVNSSGRRESSGSAFNPSSFYSYQLHPAADVPNLLRTHAGPQANIGL